MVLEAQRAYGNLAAKILDHPEALCPMPPYRGGMIIFYDLVQAVKSLTTYGPQRPFKTNVVMRSTNPIGSGTDKALERSNSTSHNLRCEGIFGSLRCRARRTLRRDTREGVFELPRVLIK